MYHNIFENVDRELKCILVGGSNILKWSDADGVSGERSPACHSTMFTVFISGLKDLVSTHAQHFDA